MTEAYQSSNKVSYIWQMLKQIDQYPSLDYVKGHCQIWHIKAGTILLNQQYVSTYSPLPIHGEIHVEPIFYTSTIVRKSLMSGWYHTRYIIWENCMAAEWTEVSNWHYSQMHLKISNCSTLDEYSRHVLMRCADKKLVVCSMDMVRMYYKPVYWITFRLGSCTTINHFAALLLLNICN